MGTESSLGTGQGSWASSCSSGSGTRGCLPEKVLGFTVLPLLSSCPCPHPELPWAIPLLQLQLLRGQVELGPGISPHEAHRDPHRDPFPRRLSLHKAAGPDASCAQSSGPPLC